jgi:opacity protein-like surface antigen
VGVRATLPLGSGRFVPYAQIGAGPAVAFTNWTDAGGTSRQTFFGYQIGAGAGVALMPWRSVGVLVQAAYYYAPIIANNFGQTHDSGGAAFQIGTRYAF